MPTSGYILIILGRFQRVRGGKEPHPPTAEAHENIQRLKKKSHLKYYIHIWKNTSLVKNYTLQNCFKLFCAIFFFFYNFDCPIL